MSDILASLDKAAKYYDESEIEGVGEAMAELNIKLCGGKNNILKKTIGLKKAEETSLW